MFPKVESPVPNRLLDVADQLIEAVSTFDVLSILADYKLIDEWRRG